MERSQVLFKTVSKNKIEERVMITVFYDGKCGLCSKEINHYRKVAPDCIFEWQDITQSADDLNRCGIPLSQGLKLLHVMDNKGNFYVGVDAFIMIWKQLPRWRVLAVIVSLPIIWHITNVAYKIFANWRFKRLEHCQIALKNETDQRN